MSLRYDLRELMAQVGKVLTVHSDVNCFWKFPEENNVPDYVLRKVQDHVNAGREVCVENALTKESITYDEFDCISRRIASKFFKLGLRKGDTVIYSTHDPAKVHAFLLGVWRANGIVRSSYPEDGGEILRKRIIESKALFIACDSNFAKETIEVANSVKEWTCQVIVFGEETSQPENSISIQEFYRDDESSLPTCTSTLDDVCLILPTSGTTGESKGAVYSHRILLECIVAFEQMPFTDTDEIPTIITSRQTHFVGSVTALSFFTRGRYLLTFPSVSVESLLEAVDEYKVRAIVGFPKYLTGLINHPNASKYDTTSLHFLTSAGQVIGPETLAIIRKLPNLRTFINLYGMTEAGLLATTADWNAVQLDKVEGVEWRDYTVGKLPPQTSLKVVNIETGQVVGAYCEGELYFKTPVMTAGYINKIQETQETFQDGWVKTGDIGYYDEDGYIYVVDRAKEIFKYYNNHISPSQIENCLLQHPGVTEAVVVGVHDPDGGGSIARAFLVVREGESVSVDELHHFVEKKLPSYMHLKGGIFIVPQIPVGKTGKVSRNLLSKLQPPGTHSLKIKSPGHGTA